MPAWNPKANDVFLDALEIAAPDERRAFIESACQGQTDLRQGVEALLRAHGEAGSFLEGHSPHAALAATLVPPISEGPGTTIGPYKLREQIGEGGMGIVYVAEQERPVRRKVALKVIKPGMDTRQVIARFEAEQQALALMDHPNIAKVLDAGTTGDSPPLSKGGPESIPPLRKGGPGGVALHGDLASQPKAGSEPPASQAGKSDVHCGRPYFVMELVKGIPITDYCDQARLSTVARLQLFIDVCRAVQHAHQKGIIHRDLKPSNVLVTEQDGRAIVKVIDFGIAKALGQQLTEKTIFTGHAQLVGTPMYMSPEQAALSAVDVDTRSDVYSLGVLLYELLTGSTPFDKETFSKVGFDELRRIIREQEHQRPSARLSTLQANALSTICDRRQVDPRRLNHEVRGELDWIVMKALEKDRARRYETASAFAADIERYLADEPVEACPPSTAYRLRKFSRRNKRALLTAAVVMVALLAGTGVSVWQALEATGARKLADQRLERETQARHEADTQRREAKQSQQSEAAQRQRAEAGLQIAMEGIDRTVRTLVDQRWIPQLRGTHKQLMQESLTLFNRLIELKPSDSRAYALRGQVQEALRHADDAVADYATAIDLDPTNHLAHYRLASFYLTYQDVSKRDVEKALQHAQRAVELKPDVQDYKLEHARVSARTVYASSIPLFEEAIKINPQNSVAYSTRADEEAQHGHFQAALDDALKARELDPENYEAHRNLARALSGLGRFEEALEAFASAKALAPFHHYIYRDLGDCLREMGRYEEAVKEYSAGWQLAPEYYIYPKWLGKAHFALSQYPRALADIAAAVELNPNDTSTLVWIPPASVAACPDESFRAGLLGVADKMVERTGGKAGPFAARGSLYAAMRQYDKALADMTNASALDPKNTTFQNNLAWFLATCPDTKLRDVARALDCARQSTELDQKSGVCWNTLGVVLCRAADWATAVTSLEKSMELRSGGDSFDWFFLAMAHWQLDHKEEARKWYDQAVEWMEKNKPQDEELRRFRTEAEELMDDK